ncbi:hypothetical protein [Streptomyces bohaiensis]|uniref:Lipoprotein n=1 Tax=Streptomyces bohaiensis TaxID=1431344 RepID=A0ABX1C8Y6_9ACTN|nr:hypothetical protein [Streptomyces bohaiensis]NJQ15602.1 hypothetical protein [Streptomyces bohaiensis]
MRIDRSVAGPVVATVLGGVLLAGCSDTGTGDPSDVSASPTDDAEPTPDDSSPTAEPEETLPDATAEPDADTGAEDAAADPGAWRYDEVVQPDGTLRVAEVDSEAPVDVDGGDDPAVLSLAEHSVRGGEAWLDLPAGSVDCSGECTVRVSVDDADPMELPASRDGDDEARLRLGETEEFYGEVRTASTVSMEVPVSGVGTVQVSFRVTGFDPEHFPGRA